MFKPKEKFEGRVRRLAMGANAVMTKWGHVKKSSGYLVAGASGDDEAEYIALETVTDTTGNNGGTFCDVIPITDGMQIEALCVTTPVQATHVGNDYDFGSAVALDLTGTTDKVFHIDEIVNANSKLVRGHFNKPALA